MPVQSKPARVSEGVPAQSQHPAFNLRSSATRRSQSAVGTPSSSATSALPARRTTRSQGAAGAPASVASELPAHRNTRSSARVVPNVNAGRSKRTRESEAVEEPLARPAKRPSLKQAAVPAPDVDCFPSLVGAKDQHRSPEAQLKMSEDKAKHNARRWYKRCPVFIDRSVTAKELYARDKNTKKEKEKAESVMESMKSWAADAGSLAIVDRKGKLLFAYCGVAFPGSRHPTYGDLRAGRVKLKDLRPYPGSLGRTEDDVTDEMDHDGLQAPNLERTHIAMQNVFHVTPPVVSAADKRHRGQDDMISYAVNSQLQDDEDEAMDVDEADDSSEWYSDEEDEDDKEDDSDDDEDDDNDDEDDDDKNEDDDDEEDSSDDSEYEVDADDQGGSGGEGEGHVREGIARGNGDMKDVAYERAGVHHLVHGWTMKGHPDGYLYPSRNLARSSLGNLATSNYYFASQATNLEVSHRFELAYPEEFAQYTQAFNAGVVNLFDNGPFLGRALVWKMQVGVHRDGLDQGPAAIFPCGYYTGGYLYIPDLKLKLAYRPRDLPIFLAGHLYHALDEWKPSPAPRKKGVTPGRASTVLFFPANSYRRLKGKPKFWSVMTMSGHKFGETKV